MKKISVLGATGSIGINTLKIIACNRKKYNVIALTSYKNYKKLAKFALMFNCKYAVIGQKEYLELFLHHFANHYVQVYQFPKFEFLV